MEDHDQRFKTLIRTFFADFVRAFFAKWAEHFDLDHVEWSETEVFPNPPEGSRHRLDMIAKLKVIKPFEKPLAGDGDRMIAAVHVEVESPETAAVLRPRMPYYYHFLRNTTGLPVLPIAIFLKVGFDGVGIDTVEEHFGDLTPIRFQYLYVGLPALDAIEYLDSDNPLAWALSTLMKIPPEKIMWLGEEAIRRIAGSNLNEQEKYLLGECVEKYLPLDDEKWQELEVKLKTTPDTGVGNMRMTMSEKAFENGQRKLLLDDIRWWLEKQFNSEGLQFFSEIPEELDLLTLSKLRKAIWGGQSIDDLKAMLL